jgi:hypothetical protein
MDGPMKLNRDFQELLELFGRHDVRYLVVGGWALAAHGHPRYTKDLDVWVWMNPANASAVLDALVDFGFGELGLTAEDFVIPDSVIQLGFPPNRVDLLTSPTGVTFEDCWLDRLEIQIDGVAVPFIGLDGLRQNKAASGRPQDLVDLENLRTIEN